MNIEAIAKSMYGFFGTIFLIVDATVMLYHIVLSPEPVENLITGVAHTDPTALHLIQERV
jgi:hypothetical protein